MGQVVGILGRDARAVLAAPFRGQFLSALFRYMYQILAASDKAYGAIGAVLC